MPKLRIDDTLEMHYEDDDFTDPWRKSEAVVIHHGNERGSRFWYRWVLPLARQYRVIRLDARGFGGSTVPPPSYNWSLPGFIEDLKKVVNALGLDKVHLIAETGATFIALRFAYNFPERVRSLTVFPPRFRGAQAASGSTEDEAATAAASLEQNRIEVERDGMEAWVRKSMHYRLDPSTTDPEYMEWFTQEMSKTPKEAAFGVYGALKGVDFTANLSEVKVPTLIVVSEGSYAGHSHWADEIKRLVPNSKLVVIPGTASYVQYTAPDLSIEQWKEFVAGLD